MTLPGFAADASLYRSDNTYAGAPAAPLVGAAGEAVVPAIPFCGNCDYILDNCARNGWRPRALCRACLVGDCYSGVEQPPNPDPFGTRPPRF